MTDKDYRSADPFDRAEYYRGRADECRTIAEGAVSVFTRIDMEQLADLYDDLASQIEARWGYLGSAPQTGATQHHH